MLDRINSSRLPLNDDDQLTLRADVSWSSNVFSNILRWIRESVLIHDENSTHARLDPCRQRKRCARRESSIRMWALRQERMYFSFVVPLQLSFSYSIRPSKTNWSSVAFCSSLRLISTQEEQADDRSFSNEKIQSGKKTFTAYVSCRSYSIRVKMLRLIALCREENYFQRQFFVSSPTRDSFEACSAHATLTRTLGQHSPAFSTKQPEENLQLCFATL